MDTLPEKARSVPVSTGDTPSIDPPLLSPAAAAARVREGFAAFAPTECGFVLLSTPDNARVLIALAEHQRASGDTPGSGTPAYPPLMWFPASTAQLIESLPGLSALHRRLLHRLAPGPVIFAIDASIEGVPAAAATVGVSPEGGLVARIGANPDTMRLIERTAGPVIGVEIWHGGRPAMRVGEAVDAARAGQSIRAVVVDGEPPTLSKPATVIRLSAGRTTGATPPVPGPAPSRSPPWSVLRKGAYEERFIRKQLTRRILFVCTGNTCRSPMAESIALDLIKKLPPADLKVTSAGTTASGGEPMTAEAQSALEGLGIKPVTGPSRPLTRQLLAEADEVYVMTRAHRRAVLAIDPSAAGRVATLDPAGGDIPDPIGRAQEVYTETAARMRDLIARRLQEP